MRLLGRTLFQLQKKQRDFKLRRYEEGGKRNERTFVHLRHCTHFWEQDFGLLPLLRESKQFESPVMIYANGIEEFWSLQYSVNTEQRPEKRFSTQKWAC